MEHDDIITTLIESGYFAYGTTIPIDEFLANFDVVLTTNDEMDGWSIEAIKTQLQKDQLLELAITTRVRDRLLVEGKYIGKDKGVYRVFLPTENARVAANYLDAAARKQSRAAKLLQSTPSTAKEAGTAKSRAAISGVRTARLAEQVR